MHLFANPYMWLFIVFIFALPYIFRYIRQFFPKKLQEQMAKEEACNLELEQKPEMQYMRKNVTIGFFISLLVSSGITYFSNSSIKVFTNIFMSMMSVVALYSMIVQHKVTKGKVCNYVSFRYWVAVFVIITLIAVMVIMIFGKSC